jgi:hypothetical protein
MKLPNLSKDSKESRDGKEEASVRSESTSSGPSDLSLSSLSIQDPPLRSRPLPSKTDDKAKTEMNAKIEKKAETVKKAKDRKLAALNWVPASFKSDDKSDDKFLKSRLFSQQEHGYEVEDDCIAGLRRLSSDNRSVVILVSGSTNHDSDGSITFSSGVFFSPTSQLNLAECVPTSLSPSPLIAELYAVLLGLKQLEDNYIKVVKVSGTIVDGWEEVAPGDQDTPRITRRQFVWGFATRVYMSETEYIERRWEDFGLVEEPDYSDCTQWKQSISFSRVVIATESQWIIDELCFGKSVANGKPKLSAEYHELFSVIWRIVERIEGLGVDVEFWWVDKESTEEASTLAQEAAFKAKSSGVVPMTWVYETQ